MHVLLVQMPWHVSLPREVWEKIASLMPTKTWARASWTCRTLYSVQPSALDITIDRGSWLLWVYSHWARAERIKLTIESFCRVPAVLPEGVAALSKLQVFILVTSSMRSGDTWCDIVGMWLPWVLAHAHALRYLEFPPNSLPVMPPLQRLQHLVLVADDYPPLDTFMESLRSLTSLRTLKLASKEYSKFDWHKLDLECLNSFEHVSLEQNIGEMLLPQSATLHYSGSEEKLRECWDEHALLNDIVSLGIEQLNDMDLPDPATNSPDYLHSETLTCLQWCVHSLGSMNSGPVRLDFPHGNVLAELYIAQPLEELDCLAMELPLLPHLQVLCISAARLWLRLAAPNETASRLRSMSIYYGSLRGSGVAELQHALLQRGLTLRYYEEEGENEEWYTAVRLSGKRLHRTCSSWPCRCGACSYCIGV